jgi:hypothetical protein
MAVGLIELFAGHASDHSYSFILDDTAHRKINQSFTSGRSARRKQLQSPTPADDTRWKYVHLPAPGARIQRKLKQH